MPLLVVLLAPESSLIVTVSVAALASLMLLGAVGARAGNAAISTAVIRVAFWGAVAMGLTAGIGRLVGAVV
jgi:VIT1/CCC1 family predicted Fe2+/Mn2+ transporter